MDELENKDKRPGSSVHEAAEDRRPAQWTANVDQRTFLTGLSSDKEIKAPRHEEIS